ncbi:hypothetical protein SLH49_05445 [Cognatiyoonia sp. IB215446]|uniref:hypothetical protein n=1 Tax=Cognatiyoonia sp. IB215446 TaxID=3097355 RepID=UPI002A16CCBB|nr:hypothetical protein [Cognatiyoonia sp. IB215446]MDX8347426.1 hypothetical protein [Cognatiyoonia sp. IB215446]
MRPAFIILPVLALAACATPREECIADATRDTKVLSNLINETQANLARGYAIEERQDVRTLQRSCRGKNDDGSTFFFPCNETETFTTTVPVAIDLRAEEAKLESLQERFTLAQASSDQAVLQCIAIHPE